MQKKTLTKKLLALILTCCLLAGVLPAGAMADDAELPNLLYGQWSGAAVLTPGDPVGLLLDRYASDLTADQVWAAINVEADNQAIRLDFAGVPAYTYAYLYDAATLESDGHTYYNTFCS